MRLQLAAVCLALAVSPALAQSPAGESEGAARVLVYDDDDSTTVITSAVDVRAAVPGDVEVGAHALVDTISSASVDVVSAATGRWSENRLELGARVQKSVADTDLALGYTRSQENDWLSHAVMATVARELFDRNTALSASYALTLNTVGRAADPNFERSLDSHSGELSVSQLVDRRTRVGGSYTLQLLSGFQSSPYRYVTASDGSRMPERHPDSRVRHGLTGFAVRQLAGPLFGRASYRFYADDWGVRSHTAALRLAVAPSEQWTAGVEGRYYRQDRADFYRGIYDTSYRYMSFDRELSSFWDAGGFADFAVRIGPVLADARVGALHYRFREFPALPRRTALIAGGGARVTW